MSMPKEIAVAPFLAGRWQFLALGLGWLGFVTHGVMLSLPSTFAGYLSTLGMIKQLPTGRWIGLKWRSIFLLPLLAPDRYLALSPTAALLKP